MHAFSTNTSRVKVYALLAMCSVVIAVVINWLATSFKIPNSWLISPPALAGVYTSLYIFVDRVAWRWTWLGSFAIIDVQAIDGIYAGKLIPDHDRQPRRVRVTISQTWTRLLIQLDVLDTETSTSCSITAHYEDVGNGDVRLNYAYTNHPNPGIADADMTMHQGTMELLIKPSGKTSGRYYNSRPKAGSISLTRK